MEGMQLSTINPKMFLIVLDYGTSGTPTINA